MWRKSVSFALLGWVLSSCWALVSGNTSASALGLAFALVQTLINSLRWALGHFLGGLLFLGIRGAAFGAWIWSSFRFAGRSGLASLAGVWGNCWLFLLALGFFTGSGFWTAGSLVFSWTFRLTSLPFCRALSFGFAFLGFCNTFASRCSWAASLFVGQRLGSRWPETPFDWLWAGTFLSFVQILWTLFHSCCHSASALNFLSWLSSLFTFVIFQKAMSLLQGVVHCQSGLDRLFSFIFDRFVEFFVKFLLHSFFLGTFSSGCLLSFWGRSVLFRWGNIFLCWRAPCLFLFGGWTWFSGGFSRGPLSIRSVKEAFRIAVFEVFVVVDNFRDGSTLENFSFFYSPLLSVLPCTHKSK